GSAVGRCWVCEEENVEIELPPRGHTFENGSCIVCGATEFVYELIMDENGTPALSIKGVSEAFAESDESVVFRSRDVFRNTNGVNETLNVVAISAGAFENVPVFGDGLTIPSFIQRIGNRAFAVDTDGDYDIPFINIEYRGENNYLTLEGENCFAGVGHSTSEGTKVQYLDEDETSTLDMYLLFEVTDYEKLIRNTEDGTNTYLFALVSDGPDDDYEMVNRLVLTESEKVFIYEYTYLDDLSEISRMTSEVRYDENELYISSDETQYRDGHRTIVGRSTAFYDAISGERLYKNFESLLTSEIEINTAGESTKNKSYIYDFNEDGYVSQITIYDNMNGDVYTYDERFIIVMKTTSDRTFYYYTDGYLTSAYRIVESGTKEVGEANLNYEIRYIFDVTDPENLLISQKIESHFADDYKRVITSKAVTMLTETPEFLLEKVEYLYDKDEATGEYTKTITETANENGEIISHIDIFSGEYAEKFSNVHVEVLQPSNCEEDGLKAYNCPICGNDVPVTIPAGHVYGDGLSDMCMDTEEHLSQYADGTACTATHLKYSSYTDPIDGKEYAVCEGKVEGVKYWESEIIIPKIDDYGRIVKVIGQGAFKDDASITSVTLPDTITSIGDSAFYNAARLTTVNIPSSVQSIGEYAFELTLLSSAGDDFYVQNIGRNAFGTTNLTSVVFKNADIVIGENAFDNCFQLAEADFTAVTAIGASIADNAFSNCENVVIVCKYDSPAYRYAIENGINRIVTDATENEYGEYVVTTTYETETGSDRMDVTLDEDYLKKAEMRYDGDYVVSKTRYNTAGTRVEFIQYNSDNSKVKECTYNSNNGKLETVTTYYGEGNTRDKFVQYACGDEDLEGTIEKVVINYRTDGTKTTYWEKLEDGERITSYGDDGGKKLQSVETKNFGIVITTIYAEDGETIKSVKTEGADGKTTIIECDEKSRVVKKEILLSNGHKDSFEYEYQPCEIPSLTSHYNYVTTQITSEGDVPTTKLVTSEHRGMGASGEQKAEYECIKNYTYNYVYDAINSEWKLERKEEYTYTYEYGIAKSLLHEVSDEHDHVILSEEFEYDEYGNKIDKVSSYSLNECVVLNGEFTTREIISLVTEDETPIPVNADLSDHDIYLDSYVMEVTEYYEGIEMIKARKVYQYTANNSSYDRLYEDSLIFVHSYEDDEIVVEASEFSEEGRKTREYHIENGLYTSETIFYENGEELEKTFEGGRAVSAIRRKENSIIETITYTEDGYTSVKNENGNQINIVVSGYSKTETLTYVDDGNYSRDEYPDSTCYSTEITNYTRGDLESENWEAVSGKYINLMKYDGTAEEGKAGIMMFREESDYTYVGNDQPPVYAGGEKLTYEWYGSSVYKVTHEVYDAHHHVLVKEEFEPSGAADENGMVELYRGSYFEFTYSECTGSGENDVRNVIMINYPGHCEGMPFETTKLYSVPNNVVKYIYNGDGSYFKESIIYNGMLEGVTPSFTAVFDKAYLYLTDEASLEIYRKEIEFYQEDEFVYSKTYEMKNGELVITEFYEVDSEGKGKTYRHTYDYEGNFISHGYACYYDETEDCYYKKCKVCGDKVLMTEDLLEEYHTQHEYDSENNCVVVSCNICGYSKTYSSEELADAPHQYDYHVLNHETGKLLYTCTKCSYENDMLDANNPDNHRYSTGESSITHGYDLIEGNNVEIKEYCVICNCEIQSGIDDDEYKSNPDSFNTHHVMEDYIRINNSATDGSDWSAQLMAEEMKKAGDSIKAGQDPENSEIREGLLEGIFETCQICGINEALDAVLWYDDSSSCGYVVYGVPEDCVATYYEAGEYSKSEKSGFWMTITATVHSSNAVNTCWVFIEGEIADGEIVLEEAFSDFMEYMQITKVKDKSGNVIFPMY
ncbi:MAG: leucine-rich repeat domain-containing protein, partial [Lachnospiraceae bacterium]|nr:leucine-rich repeat domain-containing protein [Lachnospiraceae bacterium]